MPYGSTPDAIVCTDLTDPFSSLDFPLPVFFDPALATISLLSLTNADSLLLINVPSPSTLKGESTPLV